jgi:hypothetical protein
MPKTLVDMSFVKQAVKMSTLSVGAQSLINNIINDSNTSNINTPGGAGSKDKFYNHAYDKDPATNGGKLSGAVAVLVYYMPANKNEYDNYEVIDKAVGMLSGRRRLLTRAENDKWSFYMTSHPREQPGLRTNVYGQFTPINTAG